MKSRALLAVPLAVAAAVLWFGASTAAATTLTYSPGLLQPPETAYTGSLDATPEAPVTFETAFGSFTCSSVLKANVESHGEGVPAKGVLTSLSFTGCSGSWTVSVISLGSFAIEETAAESAVLRSTGALIEASWSGINCRYATNNTVIGTLTGSYATESYATLKAEASIPYNSGNFLCGKGAVKMSGGYNITTPELLTVFQPAPEPKLTVGHKEEGKFTKNVAEEVVIIDLSSPVAYTVKEVKVGVKSGGWELIDGDKCEAKPVAKEGKEGTIVCKAQVKCLNNGKAEVQVSTTWAAGAKTYLYPAKC